MKIKETRTREVDVFQIEDRSEDLDPGWFAVIRDDCGADLWLGPFERRAEAVKEAQRRLTR